MKRFHADNKDIIVYSYGDFYETDRKKIETNRDLSEFYQSKAQPKIKKEIVNPQEVLHDIRKKLTAKELYILAEHCRSV